LVPYHSHLLLLLNHGVSVVKLCCVEGLMEVRCNLISILVNKSLYYYRNYYYYSPLNNWLQVDRGDM